MKKIPLCALALALARPWALAESDLMFSAKALKYKPGARVDSAPGSPVLTPALPAQEAQGEEPCAKLRPNAQKVLAQSVKDLAPRFPALSHAEVLKVSDGVRRRLKPLLNKTTLACIKADQELLKLLVRSSALICVEDEYLSGLEYLLDVKKAPGYPAAVKALPAPQAKCLEDAVSGYE